MKASIVIINYNDKKRIRRAIDSALNQSYKNVEVIMVDDGSDNETREIYKEYKNRTRLVQLERTDKTARTPSRARNAGIDKASGDYICFLDSDNYYATDFVKDLISLDADVAFCNWEIIGLEPYKVNIEKVWAAEEDVLKNYLRFQHLDHQCLLIKRDFLGKERYDDRLPRSQDCDLIARLILKNGDWQHCRNNLFFFEKHEQDQAKTVASVHGKTLWTLKNNLNIQWLSGWISHDPRYMVAFYQAIDDFRNNPDWNKEYLHSEFNQLYNMTFDELSQERSE